MQLFLKYSKEKIKIADKPFASGGEGNLYKILSPKSLSGYVAKIYHPEKRNSQRKEKMQYLYKNPPEGLEKGQHPAFIWITDILHDTQKNFMGFIMPFIKGEKLEVLTSAKLPKQLGDEWKRFDLREPNAFELRLRICFNLAAAIYHIHNTQHYVIVDLKPENIIIQPNGLVSLVDMDSVEVVEDDKVLFPAPVATPEYTPPEQYRNEARSHPLDGIDTHWDMFALSVIFYKLLFGIHPYTGSANAPYDAAVSLHEKIQHGLFVHNPYKKELFHVIPPPHQGFHSKIQEELKTLFLQTFVEGHANPMARPVAEDWCMALLHTFGDEKMLLHFQNLFRYSGYRGRGLKQPSVVTRLPSFAIKEETLIPNQYHRLLEWMPPTPTPKLPSKPIKLNLDLKDIKTNIKSVFFAILIFALLSVFSGGFRSWFFDTLWEKNTINITVYLQLLLLVPMIILPLFFTGLRYTFDKKVMSWKRLKRITHKIFNSFDKEKEAFSLLRTRLKNILSKIVDTKPVLAEAHALHTDFKAWLKVQDAEFFSIQEEEKSAIDELQKIHIEKLLQNPTFAGFNGNSFMALALFLKKKQQEETLTIVNSPLPKSEMLEVPEVKQKIEKVVRLIQEEEKEFLLQISKEMEAFSQKEAKNEQFLAENLVAEADLKNKYKHYIGKHPGNLREIIENLGELGLNSILQIQRIDHLLAKVELQDGTAILLSRVTDSAALSLASKLENWLSKIIALQLKSEDEKLRIRQYCENGRTEIESRKTDKLLYFKERIEKTQQEASHFYIEMMKDKLKKSFDEAAAEMERTKEHYEIELQKITDSYTPRYQAILDHCKTVSEQKQLVLEALEKKTQENVHKKISLEGLGKLTKEGLDKIKKLEKMAKEAQHAEENYLKYNA